MDRGKPSSTSAIFSRKPRQSKHEWGMQATSPRDHRVSISVSKATIYGVEARIFKLGVIT